MKQKLLNKLWLLGGMSEEVMTTAVAGAEGLAAFVRS